MLGATPALCSVCKADLNTSEVSDHKLQVEAAGQRECGVGPAEWLDFGPQENKLKTEETETSTSVHVYSDPNPTGSHSRPHMSPNTFNGEEQDTLHTPLMMCSVTLVDCRTMVELNRSITQEEPLNDVSVDAEEPEEPAEPEEPDDGSEDFCPSGKSSSLVLLFPQ